MDVYKERQQRAETKRQSILEWSMAALGLSYFLTWRDGPVALQSIEPMIDGLVPINGFSDLDGLVLVLIKTRGLT